MAAAPKPVRKEAKRLIKAGKTADRAVGKAIASKATNIFSKGGPSKLQEKVGGMVKKASVPALKKAQAADAKDNGKTFLKAKAKASVKKPDFKKK